MSKWVTDQTPTEQDALVWVWRNNRAVIHRYDDVSIGEPWAAIDRPAKYHDDKPIEWAMIKRQDGYQYESLSGQQVFIAKELTSDESAKALLNLVRIGGSGVWYTIRAIIDRETKR